MLTRYAQHNLTWIDLVAPTAPEVRALMREFSIDPSIAEELLVPSYKTKVERRGDAVYLILHFPALRASGGRAEQEIDFILGKHFLITTRYENTDPLHAFAKAFEVETVLGHGGKEHGGHLFAALARMLYGALADECDTVDRRLRDIEERIFTGDERRMVVELSQVGRIIHDFRQALAPHQEMLTSLEPVGTRFFGAEFSYYLRDVTAVYERVERKLQHLRDSLSELRETNNSLLSTKQNEVMKTLTVLAFFFMPLSFLAALFGMSNIPFAATPPGFWMVLGGMVVIAILCLIYFKKKEWL